MRGPTQFPYPKQVGPGANQTAAGNHTHVEADVERLPGDLAAKAASVHTHAEADVTNLVTDLAGKAATSHSHAESDVTNLTSDLAGKAATSHTHAESDVTNLTTDLAVLPKGSLYAPTHSTSTVTLSTTLGTYTTVHTAPSATYLAGRRYLLMFVGGFVKSSANGGTNAYDIRVFNGASVLGSTTTGTSAVSDFNSGISIVEWVPGSNTTVALTVQVAQTLGTVTAASTFGAPGSGGYYTLIAIDIGT